MNARILFNMLQSILTPGLKIFLFYLVYHQLKEECKVIFSSGRINAHVKYYVIFLDRQCKVFMYEILLLWGEYLHIIPVQHNFIDCPG